MTNQEPKADIPAASPRTRGYKFMRIILCICVATGVFLALLPTGIRLGVQYWLNRQPDIEARIDNIDLNLFTGSLGIYGVDLRRNNADAFRLGHLNIELDYLPLWNKHVFIRELRLSNGALHIEHHPANTDASATTLRIGGILLPQHSADTRSTVQESSAWGFGWKQIVLEQTSIVYRQPEWQAELDIDSIHAEDGASWNPAQTSTLKLALDINAAPLRLDIQGTLFAQNPALHGHISIDDFALKRLQPILAGSGIHELEGRFSCALNPTLGLKRNGDLELHWDGTLNLHQAAAATADIHLTRADLHWNGQGSIKLSPTGQNSGINIGVDGKLHLPTLQLEMLKSGLGLHQDNCTWQGTASMGFAEARNPNLRIIGNLSTAALSLHDQQRQRLLLAWSGADLLDLDMREHLNIGALSIKDMVALRPGTSIAETEPALVQCGTFKALGLETSLPTSEHDTRIELHTLHLNNLGVNLLRHRGGYTNIEQWLATSEHPPVKTAPSARSDTATEMTPAQEHTVLHWSVDTLRIDGHSQVKFQDGGVDPQVNLALHDIDLELKELNSAIPEHHNKFKLHAEVGRFSTLNLDGAISVLEPTPQGDLKGELQGFELFSVSPYLEAATGSRIDSGELDCTVSAALSGSQLNLQSHSTLRGFALGEMPPEQRERIAKNLGMPLSLALALLRDRQGNIHLDIPVSGDLSSPDIALGSIIRTALLGAVQETIKLALAPLGILSHAGRLVGIGARLELTPLPFPAASAELENPAVTLEPLRNLLEQRPNLRVKLSAPLTQADMEILSQPGTAQKEIKPETIKAVAQTLQQQRLNAVKHWLLEAHGAAPDQVLLTQPDSAIVPGAPRVEMRF